MVGLCNSWNATLCSRFSAARVASFSTVCMERRVHYRLCNVLHHVTDGDGSSRLCEISRRSANSGIHSETRTSLSDPSRLWKEGIGLSFNHPKRIGGVRSKSHRFGFDNQLAPRKSL